MFKLTIKTLLLTKVE